VIRATTIGCFPGDLVSSTSAALLQIFTLLLASLLSLASNQKEVTFCIVFVVVIAGGLVLTMNVILLGGTVSFFQSISLLGYCMFPLDIAAMFSYLVRFQPLPVFGCDTLLHALTAAPSRIMIPYQCERCMGQYRRALLRTCRVHVSCLWPLSKENRKERAPCIMLRPGATRDQFERAAQCYPPHLVLG
jgi:hypothetical protein